MFASANCNSPGQTVIGGEVRAVEEASGYLRDAGAKRVVPLSVSVPSHCRLMDPASRQLAERLESMEIREPRFPVIGNAGARPLADTVSVRQALLRQISEPLLWEDSVRFMAGAGVDTYNEVGPGKVLSGLVRRIFPEASVFGVQD